MKDSSAAAQIGVFFDKEQVEAIFQLAEKLTGSFQEGKYRKSILVSNVRRRMEAVGIDDLHAYIQYAERDQSEREQLISSLTIHTTSWFREMQQYPILEKRIVENIKLYRDKPFRIFCGACSTGEEVYSFALVLEKLRYFYHGFDYQIVGADIDPVSVKKASRAIYNQGFHEIPEEYRKFLMVGSGKTEGFFTLTKAVRDRCLFKVGNLIDLESNPKEQFDAVVCRNVLIYFHPDQAKTIVQNLLNHAFNTGMLILGKSEAFVAKDFDLENLGQTCYVRRGQGVLEDKRSSRVLVIDDSPIDRAVMKRQFEKHGMEVHCVESADEATKYLENFKVDLITLDLHMPGMNGQRWLVEQRNAGLKTPVVIISATSPAEAQRVLDALDKGAQDYFNKNDLRKNAAEIVERLEAIISEYTKGKKGKSSNSEKKKTTKFKRPDLILIGASTGGTEALVDLMANWPKDSPPVMIVQHIAHQFAQAFYERLCEVSGLKYAEPKDKLPLERGYLYMSTGDYHIGVGEVAGRYVLRIGTAMTYGVHRPSVDHLFKSACRVKGNITAALLTGMGKDGARGLLELHRKNAFTYAQDEETCVVFGMPKEAIELGAARSIGSLQFIRRGLIASISAATVAE